MTILIRNCFLVSVDPNVGNRENVDILVENGRIAAIGNDISDEGREIIDASGCIVIPGFVDTHRHLWEGGLRGVTSDYSIGDFIANVRKFGADFFRPEDMYVTSNQGMLEALNAGVTTVAEYCHNARSPDHVLESIRGAVEAGGRIVWSFSFTKLGVTETRFLDLQSRIDFLTYLATDIGMVGGDRCYLGACPEESGFWTDMTVIHRQFSAARDVGARIFMHGNASPRPDGSYKRDVARLAEIGALGPDVVLVHMGYTADDEWRMLGDAGGHVSYTPETEYQMGLGWPNIQPAIDAGVGLGFGSDITANNSADMFFQLRAALQVERSRQMLAAPGRLFEPRTPFSCADALHWGTLGGAKVLGLDNRIGSITVGKQADIVLLRADDISMTGWDRSNPAAAVMLQAGVHSVETVMVDGVIVKRGGKLVAETSGICAAHVATVNHVRAAAAQAGGFSAD